MTVVRTLVALLALAVLAPPTATAASCSVGDSGYSYNLDGEEARFRSLEARDGMNCASARYVLNDWLRAEYEDQYSHRIPTRFYDGYVTWRCRRLTRYRWQCSEKDSGTSFRFIAYLT